MRSSSAFGFSMINIIFQDNIDLYFARTRVLERLNLASGFPARGSRACRWVRTRRAWARCSGTRSKDRTTAGHCTPCRTGSSGTS